MSELLQRSPVKADKPVSQWRAKWTLGETSMWCMTCDRMEPPSQFSCAVFPSAEIAEAKGLEVEALNEGRVKFIRAVRA